MNREKTLQEHMKMLWEMEKQFVGQDILLTESRQAKPQSLDVLCTEVSACRLCTLCETRTQIVFGEGTCSSGLMFVGEAPGRDEDLSGRPFVGRAGQLLTKMIEAMGIKREDVFIANILKCRPPENRNPTPHEIEQCSPYLLRQIDLIKPKVICALGTFAAQTLLNTPETISRLRGRVQSYNGVPLVPTFHPAFLLRNSSMKKLAWEDLQLVMSILGQASGQP